MGKLDLDLLRHLPAYPFVEAAHYLDLPTSTLRAWCMGQGHPHILAAIRRVHGMPA